MCFICVSCTFAHPTYVTRVFIGVLCEFHTCGACVFHMCGACVFHMCDACVFLHILRMLHVFS